MRTRFHYGLLTHIHIHALAQTKINKSEKEQRDLNKVNKLGLIGLIENLENTINRLSWSIKEKDWAN